MSTIHIGYFFFLVAAVIHVLFFAMESFLFQKPGGHKYFKLDPKDHGAVKIWALNQGYYNLFLALGLFYGIFSASFELTACCALSMIGAGLVLLISAPQLKRGALVQLLPPLLGFIFLIIPRH